MRRSHRRCGGLYCGAGHPDCARLKALSRHAAHTHRPFDRLGTRGVSFGTSPFQRRVALPLQLERETFLLEQEPDAPEPAHRRSRYQWRCALAAAGRRGQLAWLGTLLVTVKARRSQRGGAVAGDHLQVGLGGQQQPNDVLVAACAGGSQGRLPVLVSLVDLRTSLQQHLGGGDVPLRARDVERGGGPLRRQRVQVNTLRHQDFTQGAVIAVVCCGVELKQWVGRRTFHPLATRVPLRLACGSTLLAGRRPVALILWQLCRQQPRYLLMTLALGEV
eukprot:scaffold9114_cov118-Isochrysis_galbana.AAC.4